MKNQFRLFRRQGKIFYRVDTTTGKQESLHTTDRRQAERLLHAWNEALQQPVLSFQMARAYLLASDPTLSTRTWQHVLCEMSQTKTGTTQHRWLTACKDHAFDSIRNLKIIETRTEHFLRVLKEGTVSTNVYLRRIHNFALDSNWLPLPVLKKNQWPPPHYRPKRSVTRDEHDRIVQRELNPEKRNYYKLIWFFGAAQSDLAHLCAEDIDWQHRTIRFERLKNRWRHQPPCLFSFGTEVATILQELPQQGPLFPHLKSQRSADRATDFKKRCRSLDIEGITLHSYRYAWAERAMTAGYPERFAMRALGHNSAAIHRTYAKGALMTMPPLEEYEHKKMPSEKIIPFSRINSVTAG